MPCVLHTRQGGKIIKGFFRISPNSIPNQINAFLILYFQSLHHPFSYQALASLRNGWGELENREKGEENLNFCLHQPFNLVAQWITKEFFKIKPKFDPNL